MRLIAALTILICGLGTLPAAATSATARHYALQTEASLVGYETDFGPDKITGTMPVTQADLTLDFHTLANCHVAVTLDASKATASFPFAAQALRGPLVLDAADHPQITFVSTAIHPTDTGAIIDGDLTIRGVTQPFTLVATLYRQHGTATDDLTHLEIHLTGIVHRSAFGATGWAEMVGDDVRLNIVARVAQTGA
ncbi:MAG: hypothetical protein GC186_14525 [Rhodobacteraceae bacterium]|nr:hypothetical protein [Paracoccaceae bacterium]